MTDNRICYFDYAKGILVFLVVLGHCVSYGCGYDYMAGDVYYSNWLYRIIYTFHMPAFALVSGYFIWYSIKKFQLAGLHILPFVRDRAVRLILPLAIYRFIHYLYDFCFVRSCNWKGYIYNFVTDFLFASWYIWAIFFATVIICFVHKYLKDKWWIYAIIVALSMVVPDFKYAEFKFVLPFFFIGYLYNKNIDKAPKFFKNKNLLFVAVNAVVFAVTVALYAHDTYIYISGYSILNSEWSYHLWQNILRFVCGFSGSITVLYFITFLPDYRTCKFMPIKLPLRIIADLGTSSFGIYIIHAYVNYAVRYLCKDRTGFNFWFVLMVSFVVCGVSHLATVILRKWKVTNKLFLGGK